MANEFELQVLAELSAIKSTGATTAQRIASLDERLFNNGSGVITTIQADIVELKNDRKSDAKWERFHNWSHYSMGPLLITLHTILRKYGIIV
jgi:hypothetical protein